MTTQKLNLKTIFVICHSTRKSKQSLFQMFSLFSAVVVLRRTRDFCPQSICKEYELSFKLWAKEQVFLYSTSLETQRCPGES